MPDLFDRFLPQESVSETFADGAWLLRGLALPFAPGLLRAIDAITAASPFRHMMTPGGYSMSVAMTNCGSVGWVTDRSGYRYDVADPETRKPWPEMPECFLQLAQLAAAQAGYADFRPDSCLINRYAPGSRLSLHQDRNERDFTQPIVSVSLGLVAIFQFGGIKRSHPIRKLILNHGDVAVWGGAARLCFHGVATLKDGFHEPVGRQRINLTFRHAR